MTVNIWKTNKTVKHCECLNFKGHVKRHQSLPETNTRHLLFVGPIFVVTILF